MTGIIYHFTEDSIYFYLKEMVLFHEGSRKTFLWRSSHFSPIGVENAPKELQRGAIVDVCYGVETPTSSIVEQEVPKKRIS